MNEPTEQDQQDLNTLSQAAARAPLPRGDHGTAINAEHRLRERLKTLAGFEAGQASEQSAEQESEA